MPSLGSGGPGPASNLTWNAAAQRVARVVAGNDPEVVAAAQDAIAEAVQAWNARRLWRYLGVLAPDISVTPGISLYPLPTNFRAPYTARLVVNSRSLTYVDRRFYDRVRSDQSGGATPVAYTL